jgi:hypothetical protein
MSILHTNKKVSEETRQKLKEKRKLQIMQKFPKENYPNHGMRNKKQSKEAIKKISIANMDSKNGLWKGDKVGYSALHNWVKRHKQKSELCEDCNLRKPYDLANVSGLYKRDVNDFKWLCRHCHMENDERLTKFKQLWRNR